MPCWKMGLLFKRKWIVIGIMTFCLAICHSEAVVKNVCSEYLVSGLYGVDDSALTASSKLSNHTGPEHARLHHASGWTAGATDAQPYIQVKSPRKSQTVFALLTQGAWFSSWVQTYHVYYSTDGVTWTSVNTPNQGPRLFTGNSDHSNVMRPTLGTGISATYIRIFPVSWHHSPSLRFDMSGCYNIELTESSRSGFYRSLSMLAPKDLANYKMLEVQTQSVLECGSLCHQTDLCHAFIFDQNQKTCRDVTALFNGHHSASSPDQVSVFVNEGILEALGFRKLPNGDTLYKIIERNLDQTNAVGLCDTQYSQLIRITSESDIQDLQSIIAKNPIIVKNHYKFFVSGKYIPSTGKYSYGTEMMGLIPWSDGHPNPNVGLCVMLTNTGLASASCAATIFCICGA